jgi:hypothetical protein
MNRVCKREGGTVLGGGESGCELSWKGGGGMDKILPVMLSAKCTV